MRPAILTALLLGGLLCPPPAPAADKPPADKPPSEKPAADKPTADLSKKFIVLTRVSGNDTHSDLLKKVEFRKLGTREFLVGEYCVNEKAGVDKEWEGVEVWVPAEAIESMIVFADEAKAWSTVKLHNKKD